MTTSTKTEALVTSFDDLRAAEARTDRNGWIAVVLAAALVLGLVAVADRFAPESASVDPDIALLD